MIFLAGLMLMTKGIPASTIDLQNPKTTAAQDEHSKRTPLLRSEKDNCNGVSNNKKKTKSRIVSSRYMSPTTSSSTSNSSLASLSFSSSRRCSSPLVSRNSTPVSNGSSLGLKRSASVDRRRPEAARTLIPDLNSKQGNAADVSAATKLLVTSTRRLSVSFQGEAFSLPVSKTKVAPSPNLSCVRKGTPERKRTVTPLRGYDDKGGDQREISKLADQHRWPSRNRLENPLSRSLDCCIGENRSNLTRSGGAIRELIDERRPSFDSRLGLDLGNSELFKAVLRSPDGNSLYKESSVPSDPTASDSDSVSSGSTSGVQECSATSRRQNGSRGIVALARFWQETNSRLRRLQDPGSPLSTSPGSKLMASQKLKRYTSDGPLSAPRTMSSPIRGGIRPAPPGNLMTPVGSSPSRGYSPSRIRNAAGSISSNFGETPSVLSFAVDVRRGKVGENRIVDAHLLRLFYNRHLQWRFVNARTDAVLLGQKHNAEKNLWNSWITISDLRDTVTKRRYRLQLLRQKLKIAFILKGQMTFLEDWSSLDKEYSFSLLGAVEALKASTLRLPVVGATTADIQRLNDAIDSAIDAMRAVTSSISLFLPPVEEVNSFATELAKVTAKERAALEQCTDLIFSLAAMQVKDSSLRTHLLQHNRVSTGLQD